MLDEKNTQEIEASQSEENLESDDVESTEEESSEDETNVIDYKAELERIQEEKASKEEQLSKAEHTIENLKRDKRVRPDEIQKLIEEEISKRFQSVEKTALQSSAQQIASSIASNSDEAALIMYHYQNTIIPSGNLNEDMEVARVIANRKRIQTELEETKRALSSPKPSSASSSSNKKTEKTAPKLSSQEASFIKNANMKWNSKTNRYEGTHVALQLNDRNEWQSVRLSQD